MTISVDLKTSDTEIDFTPKLSVKLGAVKSATSILSLYSVVDGTLETSGGDLSVK